MGRIKNGLLRKTDDWTIKNGSGRKNNRDAEYKKAKKKELGKGAVSSLHIHVSRFACRSNEPQRSQEDPNEMTYHFDFSKL